MTSTEPPSISSTRPEDWSYLAEGGANLVLTYRSQDNSAFNRKVLRLRKRNKAGKSLGGEADTDFHNFIIQPLFPHAVELETAPVEREWLQGVQKMLDEEETRPQERRETSEIDVESQFGILADDLLGGEGFAFEIKPKWGFLPSFLESELSPSTRSTKSTYCRFCMHRYHRSGSLNDHAEGYCPLDLYSGEEARVRKAVDDLFSLWVSSDGEANNFRIFHSGTRATPGDLSPLAASFEAASSLSSLREHILSLLVPALLSSPLLANLCQLQSSLDSLDVDGLASRISTELNIDLSDPSVDLSPLGPQPTVEEWQSFLSTFRQTPTSQLDLRQLVLSYLLSATFKDCSIIVRPSTSSNLGQEEATLKAIDLDPKPIKKLAKWYELDRAIVENWKKMLEGLSEEGRDKLRKCSG
ncbi:inositol-pentakisphosphate 2-kinase [Sporobolomyces salmoneus]|uniref:inositol-pentakisphosphate 2-kinase n=1 Tax=Sporobolomyces salmoneus TaxID=183962 RepID=UPI003176511D